MRVRKATSLLPSVVVSDWATHCIHKVPPRGQPEGGERIFPMGWTVGIKFSNSELATSLQLPDSDPGPLSARDLMWPPGEIAGRPFFFVFVFHSLQKLLRFRWDGFSLSSSGISSPRLLFSIRQGCGVLRSVKEFCRFVNFSSVERILMAEICCELIGEGEAPAAVETNSRATRRRRMEACPIVLMADATLPPPAMENSRKRLKTDGPPRECDNAVENCTLVTNRVEERDGEDSNEGNCHENQTVSLSNASNIGIIENEIWRPKFGVTSICGRRREMEDAVSIHPSFCYQKEEDTEKLHLFGVFDGHGCSHVAKKCQKRLHEIIKEEIKQEGETMNWKKTMEKCYVRMDEELKQRSNGVGSFNCRCELQASQSDAVGSTAVVAVVTPEKIIVSNCGDSRAVLCRNGVAIPLSSDHKPDRPDELERIEAAGGRVIYWDGARVLGVLAMSRAIGDNYLKPYVIPVPEVTITDRTAEDECLIIASDGLWDVVKNETACGVARMCLQSHSSTQGPSIRSPGVDSGGDWSDKTCSDASILLTKLALARHGSDNISVVVVDLRK